MTKRTHKHTHKQQTQQAACLYLCLFCFIFLVGTVFRRQADVEVQTKRQQQNTQQKETANEKQQNTHKPKKNTEKTEQTTNATSKVFYCFLVRCLNCFLFLGVGHGFRRTYDVEVQATQQQWKHNKKIQQAKHNRKRTQANKNKQKNTTNNVFYFYVFCVMFFS